MASKTYTLTFSRLVGEFTSNQKDLLGSGQDPYVVFQAGGNKAQTKAIKGVGAGTAEWRETYTLESFSPSSSTLLEVVVYNHNTLRPDSVIGSGSVDLSNMGENKLSGSGESISVPLTSKKGDNVGNLSFVVNGGGFTGRSTGTGTGNAGYNSGSTGYGAAGAAGAAGGTGMSRNRGVNAGEDDVVGVGAGTDKHSAKEAAKEAAREGQEVSLDTDNGAGVGAPVGNQRGNVASQRGNVSGANMTAGAGAGKAGEYAPGEVIDRKYYTGVENRPQDQALVEQYREHNPYAKEYETTVQHTGRERQVGSNIEALGTTERVIGSDHIMHSHPHQEIARNLPEGAMNERPGGPGWVETKPGPICDSNTFTVTGDRPVDKERVTDLKEHRDFEKEFEVKTQLKDVRNTGEGVAPEMLNRERVLVDEKSKNACEGHPDAATASTGSGYGTAGNTGSATQAGYGSQGTNANTGYGNNASTY